MKNLFMKLLVVAISVVCAGFLFGCGKTTSRLSDMAVEQDKKIEEINTTEEEKENKEENMKSKEQERDNDAAQRSAIITEYKWQNAGDSSLIVCETDGSFKYYRSAEDLTNNYFEGTYDFFMGEEAVTYITTTLSSYSVTKEKLEGVFARNKEYDEANFVVFVLNNEACMVDGENQVEAPYKTPYFGFCVEAEGVPCLDIANMNSGNYHFFVAK